MSAEPGGRPGGPRGLVLAVAQSISAPRDPERNVARHADLAAAAADRGARFVLFPELSLTGYDRGLTPRDALDPGDGRLEPLSRIARARGLVLVTGAPLTAPDGLHIGAVVFHPDGSASTYRKQHLHEGEEVAFRPGPGGALLELAGERIGLAICADASHPEHARDAAGRGATLYAASAFITPDGYAADAALLRRYATEHGMAVLVANHGAATGGWPSAGRSAAWAAGGALLACAPAAGEALVLAERGTAGWGATAVPC